MKKLALFLFGGLIATVMTLSAATDIVTPMKATQGAVVSSLDKSPPGVIFGGKSEVLKNQLHASGMDTPDGFAPVMKSLTVPVIGSKNVKVTIKTLSVLAVDNRAAQMPQNMVNKNLVAIMDIGSSTAIQFEPSVKGQRVAPWSVSFGFCGTQVFGIEYRNTTETV